ncbi:MAG: glycosyltransferase family 39 protein [Pseudomonadota bacterium]
MAGLSHWKFGRFELYRVNPPLVRMVAALPVIAVGYEEDWSGFYEGPGARPVFSMGEDFVAANGERTFLLTMIARWACMPFSWLGAIVCYLWGRDLYGQQAGLVACFVWCFEPNILANASLYTADAHSAALGLAACYTFWKWLRQPTWTQAVITGVVLGVAELAKTTLILFYPLWPLIWLAYRWAEWAQMTTKRWLSEAAMLALRIAIGLYVVNLGYGFEGSFKPLGEFHFVSNLFTGKAAEHQQSDTPNPQSINRFQGTSLEHLPVPFPKNYLLGMDIQQNDFENYGRPFYLRGEWSQAGWWYYYLYAGAVKVPLGLLLLGAVGCFCPIALRTFGCKETSSPVARAQDTLTLLTPAVVVLCVVSLKTGINEHFRYVLPAFPFLFVWVGGGFQSFCKLAEKKADYQAPFAARSMAHLFSNIRLLCSLLLMWLAASSLWVYPHSLSYFNESIGGPIHGTKHLLGSNMDWGQDLRYVKSYIDQARLNVGPPFRFFFHNNSGGAKPAHLGLEQTALASDSRLVESVEGDVGAAYRFAVSTDVLFGVPKMDSSTQLVWYPLASLTQGERGEQVERIAYTAKVFTKNSGARPKRSLNEAAK